MQTPHLLKSYRQHVLGCSNYTLSLQCFEDFQLLFVCDIKLIKRQFVNLLSRECSYSDTMNGSPQYVLGSKNSRWQEKTFWSVRPALAALFIVFVDVGRDRQLPLTITVHTYFELFCNHIST